MWYLAAGVPPGAGGSADGDTHGLRAQRGGGCAGSGGSGGSVGWQTTRWCIYLQDAAQSARLFAIDEARLLKPQMWHADLLSIASLGAIAMLSERGVPPYFPAIYIQGLG